MPKSLYAKARTLRPRLENASLAARMRALSASLSPAARPRTTSGAPLVNIRILLPIPFGESAALKDFVPIPFDESAWLMFSVPVWVLTIFRVLMSLRSESKGSSPTRGKRSRSFQGLLYPTSEPKAFAYCR